MTRMTLAIYGQAGPLGLCNQRGYFYVQVQLGLFFCTVEWPSIVKPVVLASSASAAVVYRDPFSNIYKSRHSKQSSCWFNYVCSQRHSRHLLFISNLSKLVLNRFTKVYASCNLGILLTPVNTPNGAIAAPNTAFVQELVRCPDLASVSRGWGDYKCLICLSYVEHRLLWDRLPALGLRHPRMVIHGAGVKPLVRLAFAPRRFTIC